MGYGTTMMILLLCMTAGLWAVGYTSGITEMSKYGYFDQTSGMSWVNMLINKFTLTALLVGGLTALGLGGSFGVIYAIPAGAVVVIADLLAFPMQTLYNASLPFPINILLFGMFNILLIATIISFIRGAEL